MDFNSETEKLMALVGSVAAWHKLNDKERTTRAMQELKQATYMALSRAYGEGYEIGQNGEVDE